MEADVNLTVGHPAQTFDKQEHGAVEHVDDEENSEKLW